MQPEPCMKGRCRSPVACGGWGYCRERNILKPGDKWLDTNTNTVKTWTGEKWEVENDDA